MFDVKGLPSAESVADVNPSLPSNLACMLILMSPIWLAALRKRAFFPERYAGYFILSQGFGAGDNLEVTAQRKRIRALSNHHYTCQDRSAFVYC
jgi:hypothetical protein